ncbi:MAG: hypothetical protein HKN57_12935 [Xanthomonadales bacterium]|nr:hypothetical protein [Gammaproteobacteria bacterium]NND58142.1 hypothetical protein [Xanthomonadales bacterium]NNK50415.1 hypothetical protein [Xanthomonadales bacterium]
MNQWLHLARFLGTRLMLYLAAVIVTYLLAAVTATQSVIASLAGMGVNLDFSERIAMTWRDITGMAGMLLPMVAFGLLIAFMTTALICRYVNRWRLPLYMLAGATALVCIHLSLHFLFSITPLAIARTAGGLALQAAAGAAGGLTYVLMSRTFFTSKP